MTTDHSDAKSEIDGLIVDLDDWRGEQLAEVRELIHEALPDVKETWKYKGSPVWEQDGAVAVGNAHKKKVKLTFPQGAHLEDPVGVFITASTAVTGEPSTSSKVTA